MSSGYFGIDPETEKRLARAVKFTDCSNHNDFIFQAMLEKIERCEQDMSPEMLAKPKRPESAKDAPPSPAVEEPKPRPFNRGGSFGDFLADADAGATDYAAPLVEVTAPAVAYLAPAPDRKRPVPSSVELEAEQRARLAGQSPSFAHEAKIVEGTDFEPMHPAQAPRRWRRVGYGGVLM